MLTFSIIYIVKFEIFFNRKSDHHRCCLFPIDTCVCVLFSFIYLYCMSSQTDLFFVCFFFRPEIASILILIVIFLLFSSFNSKTLFIYLNKKKRKLFGFFRLCV
jgi:hypothetical protein